MRVFLIDKSHYIGGAERSLALLLRTLPAEVEAFLVMDYPMPHQSECISSAGVRVLFRTHRLAFVTVFLDRFSGNRIMRGLLRIWNSLLLIPLLISKKPDIADFNLFRTMDMWDMLLCRMFRVKTVAHVRSLASQIRIPERFISLADRFICVSQNVYDGFTRIPENRKKVVYNAVSAVPRILTVSQSEARQITGMPAGGTLIGSVAVCESRKGHDLAISAFLQIADKFPDAKLLIIGKDPTSDQREKKRLRQLAGTLADSGRIIFTAFPPGKMQEAYRSLDLVLALSWDGEAFGRVPVEAGVCERTSIATRIGAFQEIIRDGESGFLATSDATEIAEKMDHLLSSPYALQRMGKAAYQFVAQNFSAERNAAETFEVYQSLMQEKRI